MRPGRGRRHDRRPAEPPAAAAAGQPGGVRRPSRRSSASAWRPDPADRYQSARGPARGPRAAPGEPAAAARRATRRRGSGSAKWVAAAPAALLVGHRRRSRPGFCWSRPALPGSTPASGPADLEARAARSATTRPRSRDAQRCLRRPQPVGGRLDEAVDAAPRRARPVRRPGPDAAGRRLGRAGRSVRYLPAAGPRRAAGRRRRDVLPDGPVDDAYGPGAEADPAGRAELVRRARGWTPAAGRYAARPPPPGAAGAAGRAWPRLRGGGPPQPRAAPPARPPDRPRPVPARRPGSPARAGTARRLPHLRSRDPADPENLSAWFVRGTLPPGPRAARAGGACASGRASRSRRDFAPAWLNRGLAFGRLRLFDQAVDDFDRALRLDPTLAEAYVQRAAAAEGLATCPGRSPT